jgi:hypothetical protein
LQFLHGQIHYDAVFSTEISLKKSGKYFWGQKSSIKIIEDLWTLDAFRGRENDSTKKRLGVALAILAEKKGSLPPFQQVWRTL